MRVILCYKNFGAFKGISHIGLGVSALNVCKVLTQEGIPCEVWPIVDWTDLQKRLKAEHESPCHPSITHVVIAAPWIPTKNLNELCRDYPCIHFAMTCHSAVGFLQADPNGTRLLREAFELELGVPNFSVMANSEKMRRWAVDAYGHMCGSLPNLYFLNGIPKHHMPLWNGGVLKIGVFGATRPQKNIASAVGAAVEIAYQLKAQTQIWLSSGRTEGGGNTILNTVKAMTVGLPSVTLHEAGWLSWAQFRSLVGSMHLLLQPSYTESFNMVSADGIAEGVATVVSDAIDWVPSYWVAHADDVFDIAQVGRRLLADPHAAFQGYQHLVAHNEKGLMAWKKHLKISQKPFHPH